MGVKTPEAVEGKSLRRIFSGSVTRVRDTLFTTYENIMRAVRDDRWKLIHYPQIGHTQLFDLESDPHELENLAGHAKHAARVGQLFAKLRVWQAATDDKEELFPAKKKPKYIDLTGRKRKPDAHQPEWIREKYFEGLMRVFVRCDPGVSQ